MESSCIPKIKSRISPLPLKILFFLCKQDTHIQFTLPRLYYAKKRTIKHESKMHSHSKSSSISSISSISHIMKNPFRRMKSKSMMPKMDDKMGTMEGMDGSMSNMSMEPAMGAGMDDHMGADMSCSMENGAMSCSMGNHDHGHGETMGSGMMGDNTMMEGNSMDNNMMESKPIDNSMAMMDNKMTMMAPKPLTVIELFQSQSCSSCPPANNHLLNTIPSDDPNALLLTYEVTYWNHLSWVDTFSDQRWDQRQRDYVYVIGLRAPFTPQLIVDGGAGLPNEGWWDIKKTLKEKAKDTRRAVTLKVVDSGASKVVEISGSDKAKAYIQVVWYEPKPAPVSVLRGENRGVTIEHRNVVRDLKIIGKWEGGNARLELPAGRKGLKMAVLAQRSTGGHILGAARV